MLGLPRASASALAPLLFVLVGLAVTASAAPPKASSLGEIRKEHDADCGDGLKGVRLTVPAEVVGLEGSSVACVVFFLDDAGAYVTSVLPQYNGRDGSMRVVSPDVRVAKDPDGIDFVLRAPYAAFPKRPSGKYRVEARARLVLRGASRNVLLAEQSTRFWVEG